MNNTSIQTQHSGFKKFTCFLFAMTVASFINVGRACDPAETVTCNGLSYAWPKRLQHSLVNSSATVSQWEGASRSEYGDTSRRPAQRRHPMSLCMSLMWHDANGPKDALAYCKAAARPVLWSTWTNWSWCNWNSRDEPCLHHDQTTDIRLVQHCTIFKHQKTWLSIPNPYNVIHNLPFPKSLSLIHKTWGNPHSADHKDYQNQKHAFSCSIRTDHGDQGFQSHIRRVRTFFCKAGLFSLAQVSAGTKFRARNCSKFWYISKKGVFSVIALGSWVSCIKQSPRSNRPCR